MPGARNRWSIEQDILEQALRSRTELRELEREPRKALEQALGERLPPDVTVRIAFDTRHRLHQVIPFEGHRVLGSVEPPNGADAIDGMRGISVAAAHRAGRDPEFRARLLADPVGFAREGLHKLTLPDEIVVLVEDERTIWLHVPLLDRPHVREGRRGRGGPGRGGGRDDRGGGRDERDGREGRDGHDDRDGRDGHDGRGGRDDRGRGP